MKTIQTPVSPGEILDKITILEIKVQAIKDAEKQKNVRHELEILLRIWNDNIAYSAEMDTLKNQLKEVNQKIWNIEDAIRLKEASKSFDDAFIQIARSVYFQNDKRAAIKKEINLLLGSELIEEKSYQNYE